MMKYLIPALQARPGSVQLSQAEFQQLLVDVQVGRSATRSADEFYESLDRIVNELKASPEAEPFLRPVSKKLAADYDQYVKHPMDLSTVQKNVKAKAYKSKKGFARDLNLIWSNCLLYNALETHPMRAQAKLMKQKADHYLTNLADRLEPTGLNIPIPVPQVQRVRYNQFSARSSSSAHGWGRESGGDVDMVDLSGDAGMDDSLVEAEDDVVGDLLVDETYQPPSTASADYTTMSRTVGFHHLGVKNSASASSSSLKQPLDLSLQPHKPLPKKRKEAPPFWFPPGPSSPTDNGPSSAGRSAVRATSATGDALEDPGWWNEIQSPQAYASGIPAIPKALEVSPSSSAINGKRISGKRKQIKPDDAAGPAPMETLISRNIDSLFNMRLQVNKISARLAGTEWNSDEEESSPIGKRRRKVGPLREDGLQQKEAVDELRVVNGMMLAHAGFEGANQDCIDTLTTVAGNYIRNLGKTLRLYLDTYADKMTSEEIILHALFENGGLRPHDLDLYIRDDVERYGVKLRDAEKKLKAATVDQPSADAEEPEFGEDDFAFGQIPGLEDMFGFGGAIPKHLLQGTKKPTSAGTGLASKIPVIAGPDFPPPPPVIPLTMSDIPHQIGLLQGFYYSRAEHNPPGLADDPDDATGMTGMGVILPPKVSVAGKAKNGGGAEGDPKKKSGAKSGVGKGKWDRKAAKTTATTPVEPMDLT